MPLELIEGINLWSVTVQSELSFNSEKNPENFYKFEIGVYQIIVGKTQI